MKTLRTKTTEELMEMLTEAGRTANECIELLNANHYTDFDICGVMKQADTLMGLSKELLSRSIRNEI